MVILDTDHMSVYEWSGSAQAEPLRARLAALPQEEQATTIVSFEEQTRGWLAYLSRTRTMGQLIEAYRRLARQLENYCKLRVLPFDELAATEYQRLNKLRLRVGSMDLRIAAIVLAHNATLLSRNLADFGRIPGLKVEDWTVEAE